MDVGGNLRPDQLSPDNLSIDTPELVSIEMPLAGIGSRFIALLVDYLIWGAGLFLVGILALLFLPALRAFRPKSAQWAEAIAIFILFLFNWGYFTLFGMAAPPVSAWRGSG
jgi:uncharacterized RDD family membrane protein YckC